MSHLLKKNQQFAHFWCATWAICSHRSSKKGNERIVFFKLTKNEQKHTKKYDFSQIFLQIARFLWAKEKWVICLKNEGFAHSLIYHERLKRIAHRHSFVMSDLSNLRTVAHWSWAIWANRSQSLIWSEWSEQWVNERIPNPDVVVVRGCGK